MKDNEFDQIGKSLYDGEAEPPKNGWDKINVALHQQDVQHHASPWRRHWWKPLLLLLPITVYLLQQGDKASALDSLLKTGKASTASIINDAAEVETKKQNGADRTPVSVIPEAQPTASAPEQNSIPTQNEKTRGQRSNSQLKPAVEKAVVSSRQTVSSQHKSIEPLVTLPADQTSEKTFVVKSEATENDATHFVHGETLQEKVIVMTDSIALAMERMPEATEISKDSVSPKEEQTNGNWRITIAVSPQYFGKTARPTSNDDILLTNIKQSKASKNLGYSFSIGLGKHITRSLIMEGELSFMQGRQEVNYSQATGNIDTLIAVKQPDNSIRLKPVYEVLDQRVAYKYQYLGIRLGSTYYFHSTARGRFNVAGSVGAYYLLNSDVVKGTGSSMRTVHAQLTRATYNITLGAGYSISMKDGWEFMLSPNTTYFLRAIKGEHQPYSLSRQAFGVNFRVAKTISF